MCIRDRGRIINSITSREYATLGNNVMQPLIAAHAALPGAAAPLPNTTTYRLYYHTTVYALPQVGAYSITSRSSYQYRRIEALRFLLFQQ